MAEFHLTSTEKHEPNWRKALGCWQTVLNVNPNHLEARRKLMDYYYQMGDSGGSGAWKMVEEHSSKLLEAFAKTQKEPDIEVLMANARASLETARVGTSAFREALVTKAITDLEALKKKTPDNARSYEYLIEATLLNRRTGLSQGCGRAEG
jgi:tetratricopeptide (TPR) repeat protein